MIKKIGLKFTVAFGAIVVGIFSVWLSFGVKPPDPLSVPPQPVSTENTVPLVPGFVESKSGKVLLRSKGFEQAKDLFAKFELVNDTAQPIAYVSYSYYNFKDKDKFCKLAVRQEFAETRGDLSECVYAPKVYLQALGPGDTATFSVGKWDVKTLVKLEAIQPEITTHVGFEIFKGQDGEKEIVWSDEFTFPRTLD